MSGLAGITRRRWPATTAGFTIAEIDVFYKKGAPKFAGADSLEPPCLPGALSNASLIHAWLPVLGLVQRHQERAVRGVLRVDDRHYARPHALSPERVLDADVGGRHQDPGPSGLMEK